MLTIKAIYQQLYAHYGQQYWWPAKSHYEMMVGAILVQNTRWENVEKALGNLHEVLSPHEILIMDEAELAYCLRPSGYYNQKAERLKRFTAWFAGYHYDVNKVKAVQGSELRRQLLAIKGIGRETADCMLVYAFDKAYFIVDAYTRRILSRIGYVLENNYDDVRLMIEADCLPDVAYYAEYHALLVRQAKQYCQKAIPQCRDCPLAAGCNYALFYES